MTKGEQEAELERRQEKIATLRARNKTLYCALSDLVEAIQDFRAIPETVDMDAEIARARTALREGDLG